MLRVTREQDCEIAHFPGRDWLYLIGPKNSPAQNMTFGVAVFFPNTETSPHVHDVQEEIIYIISGRGRQMAGDQEMPLEPGVALFTPPGVPHQVVVDGDEPLKLVTVFSPPVVPGSYDPKS